jgi:polysaccharide export outer membrane protein
MTLKFKLRQLALATYAAVTLLSISACSTYKKVPYFQDLNRAEASKEDIDNYSTLTIQPQDQLSINVGSLNAEASAVFNNNQQNAGANPNNPTYGYLVSQNGEIKLPLVGTVKVSGLTTEQLSQQLQTSLVTYLREPTVSVRIVNFKIAVIGDVMRPDMYSSPGERLTVTEALSLAGDLNITAKRNKREYITLDLTSKDLFKSPYFYLKSHDLLYVEPGKLKVAAVDTGYRNASLIISALSVLAITISILQ